MIPKGKLFDDIVSRITKSMGGGKKPKSQEAESETEEEEEEENEGEEVVEATEVIKALTDQVEALKTGQEELLKAIAKLAEQSAQDAEFKKSMGEGMIALMQGYAAIAKTPLPRKGVGALDAAGMNKGGFPGAAGTPRHRQFTAADLDEVKDALCKAVANKQLTLLESSQAETQINKSIQNPAFQIDPKFLTILAGGNQ